MKTILSTHFPFQPPLPDSLAFFHAVLTLLFEGQRELSLAFKDRLDAQLQEQDMKRLCLLLPKGDIPQRVYFLVSGTAVIFAENHKDSILSQEACYILEAGAFILPLLTLNQQPSPVSIQLYADSRLLSISAEAYIALVATYAEAGELSVRWHDRQKLLRLNDHARLKSYKKPVDKILWFMCKWPDCFTRFNSHIIAAYTGLGRSTVAKHHMEVLKAYMKGERRV